MSESQPNRGHPYQIAAVVLLLVAGGWYFLRHYQIQGLDGIRVHPKSASDVQVELANFPSAGGLFEPSFDEPGFAGSGFAGPGFAGPGFDGPGLNNFSTNRSATNPQSAATKPLDDNPFTLTRQNQDAVAPPSRRLPNLKIASWALDGFGPTKLANPVARLNVVRIIHQFDIVALQQIAAIERDLVPRLIDELNQSGRHYEYVLGPSNGPDGRQEQLAFVFDTARVRVDRSQTYTVADPKNEMSFDPLVAWFQTSQPSANRAWTFSLVNIRVDLSRAPSEVALLPTIARDVRSDGRGEDDVILAGLFQADDAYLVPTIVGDQVRAAVRSAPTDIFGRYQTSNLVMDTATCSEFLGRGGVVDFLRLYNMSLSEAEIVSSHMPVYGEFTVTEGGQY
ncbi:hypothetical protein Q31b_48860 [Novipirellula aureliae]|uniref:Endonuclease/Exonuclease/phosphatase family protein n=1 Tax=Novipirellula aureliae TaxID=2527966 RepID=A0A5C6DK32_9BACT|nr:deoxyribonuclease I [Novipirellula aureliae]TWU36605.1 hypothetical protein Q31b_48860 [Novipirellula aureliae]